VRLALVIYGSLDTLSGGYLYDRRLVEHLRRAGDTVEIVSLPWRSYPAHLMDNLDPGLHRRLSALRVDLILQDELNHPSLLAANHALRRAGQPKIVSIVHHLRSSELHPRPLLALYRVVERAYLRGVDRFIFNSRTTRAAVEALAGRSAPGVVATPAGDQPGGALALEAVRRRVRQGGPLRLVFVGNLIPRKGLHTLLQALRMVDAGPWRLEIAGAPVDAGYARRMYAAARSLGERVQFLGRVTDGDLHALLARSDALVVPSTYEGFGIVYLEAMARGLPGVATQAGAAGEIIQDGKSGFLVPAGDARALAGVLNRLAADRALLERMSAAARRRYDDFPTWEQTAARARQYLCAVLEER